MLSLRKRDENVVVNGLVVGEHVDHEADIRRRVFLHEQLH